MAVLLLEGEQQRRPVGPLDLSKDLIFLLSFLRDSLIMEAPCPSPNSCRSEENTPGRHLTPEYSDYLIALKFVAP
jgi:hypothetical protein